MEEAPKGTFQDELDWCIQQLETGLIRRSPTPQQASDAQRILRVLRSRKAPFVKKRQVMNQVFGNYRLKMAEERQQQEKAATNSPRAQIQEVTNPDSRSVAYRKCSKDAQSTSTHWFTASDNNFTFSFCPDPTDNCEDPGSGHAKDSQGKCPDLEDSSQVSVLCTGEGSGFSFNFQISEDATPSQNSPEPKSLETSADQLNSNHTSLAASNMEEALEGSSQTLSNLEDGCSTSGLSENQILTLGAKTGQNPPPSPKKKKKKKPQNKNQTAQTEKKIEEVRGETDKSPLAKEDPQTGADDLRKELDWCVEQLEIGLQRQKSTPKQVEESLRAIKTLRSEKVALVKKRQVMRTMFGDYRRKMEEERRKQLKLMQTAAKSARVSQVSATARQKSSKVFRKSTHKSGSAAGQDLPAHSPDPPEPGTSSQGGFVFQSSQDPFCFNFF